MAKNDETYKGNKLIKPANVLIEYGPDEIREFNKCRKNPMYFIEHYIKIVSLDQGLIPFKPRQFQKDIINAILENRFTIFKLPRQYGKCVQKDSLIKIRNKKTGEIQEISIGTFYDNLNTSSIRNMKETKNEQSSEMRPVSKNNEGVRKFIDSIDLSDWEIETDTGWEDISVIHKTIEYRKYIIKTESGKTLECADTHIIFDNDYNEIYVKDCIPYKTFILTIDGVELVTELIITPVYENMFDITVESENHRFYSNGILSHNTTALSALMLWYILFNENFKIAVLAHKETMAIDIVSRIRLAFQYIPKWMQQGIVQGGWNKKSIDLENGSSITASATSESAIRGSALNFVYLDEFAHVPNNIQEEFFTSIFPVISSGTSAKIAITSTPKGMNLFYKIWVDAEEKRNSFFPLDVPWTAIPGRDEEWKAKMIADSSERQFAQEFECVDGDTVIDILEIKTGKTFKITIKELYSLI